MIGDSLPFVSAEENFPQALVIDRCDLMGLEKNCGGIPGPLGCGNISGTEWNFTQCFPSFFRLPDSVFR